MAFCFGDGFDLYAAPADAVAGYWDSGTATNFTLAAGRFTGSQCIRNANQRWGVARQILGRQRRGASYRLRGSADAALTGSTLGLYLQLSDAATNQVCIVFRSDGAILLTSATPAGTVLATYTGAISAQSTWTAFEFEVVIHPTAGRFRARKNGNTSDDFDSGATLPTRPGANAYANKLTVGQQALYQYQPRSTTCSGAATRRACRSWATSAATRGCRRAMRVQFARSLSTAVVSQTAVAVSTTPKAANAGFMSAFTAAYSGTIATASVTLYRWRYRQHEGGHL
jgi:hypothetical protein